ncbi:MAG: hypothetical protein AAGE80_01330 [Pseudomonadota bacterium]
MDSRRLKMFLIAAALSLGPQTSFAEEKDPIPELRDQLGEILRDLRQQIEPALQGLVDKFSILEEIDSFENYGEPEVLPNGDIIIRRRPDAPDYAPPAQRDRQTPGQDGVDT